MGNNTATDKDDKSKQQENGLTLDSMVKAYKNSIARKIQNGETSLAKELDHLYVLEAKLKAQNQKSETQNPKSEIRNPNDGEDEIGIPESLRLKRTYTMSPEAVAARRKGGKARAKTNPNPHWKHGKYARSFITGSIRPCHSTCKDYPCSIIKEGGTSPGGPCLDKAAVIQVYSAIIDAVKNKKHDDFNALAALNIAQSMHILGMMQEEIIRDGPTIKREKRDKDGNLLGHEYVPHPSLFALPKLIADLGLTPPEFLATPRALAKQDGEEKATESLAQYLSRVSGMMLKKSGTQTNQQE